MEKVIEFAALFTLEMVIRQTAPAVLLSTEASLEVWDTLPVVLLFCSMIRSPGWRPVFPLLTTMQEVSNAMVTVVLDPLPAVVMVPCGAGLGLAAAHPAVPDVPLMGYLLSQLPLESTSEVSAYSIVTMSVATPEVVVVAPA